MVNQNEMASEDLNSHSGVTVGDHYKLHPFVKELYNTDSDSIEISRIVKWADGKVELELELDGFAMDDFPIEEISRKHQDTDEPLFEKIK